MPKPHEHTSARTGQVNPVLKNVLLLLFLWHTGCCRAQSDSANYMAGIYYGMGLARPLGSISNHSSKYNQYGKVGAGLNIKAGAEFFFNNKNALSLDIEYAIFSNNVNDSLDAVVERRVASYNTPHISSGSSDGDLIVAQFNLGYSRLFRFGKFILQPKINAGVAVFSYGYSAAYGLTNALSFTNTPATAITLDDVAYTSTDINYLTLKPELTLKYIVKSTKYFDFAICAGASYFYLNPEIYLDEHRDHYVGNQHLVDDSHFVALKDRIHILNVNVSLNFTIKKSVIYALLRNFNAS